MVCNVWPAYGSLEVEGQAVHLVVECLAEEQARELLGCCTHSILHWQVARMRTTAHLLLDMLACCSACWNMMLDKIRSVLSDVLCMLEFYDQKQAIVILVHTNLLILFVA